MESEMKMVFQQKVQEKEAKLKQSEEELYARHREMKEALEKQRVELEEKKRRVEQGRPLTPEKAQQVGNVSSIDRSFWKCSGVFAQCAEESLAVL
jgi:septin 7